MVTMVADVKCKNADCGETIFTYQEGMQYANSKYKVTCPHCGKETEFTGQASRRLTGGLTNDYAPSQELD